MDILTSAAALLKVTPDRWTGLTAGVPANLLARVPATGEWSALDCLQHLVDTERWVFPARVRALLAGQDFPDFDPDSQGTKSAVNQSPAELAADFARLRRAGLMELATVTPDDLDRRARHSELGIVSLNQLLNEWVAHDLMHTVQAERALMQPFIHGSGPWQSYFQDHLARERTA